MKTTPSLNKVLGAALAFILISGFLSACGSSSSKPDTTSNNSKYPAEKITFVSGDVKVVRTGSSGEANLSDVDALLRATASYVRQSSVNPLHGELLRISDLLTASARPGAVGPASDALTDAGVAPAKGAVTVSSGPMPITILTDSGGAGALATVTIDITIKAETQNGAVSIHRVGELAFIHEGTAWLIDGWRLTVNRDGKGIASAPKTSSSTKAP